jgi:hypothetical protein
MGISYNPRTITNGLVLCLDAANRKSYPGSGTTWTDLSGNGNNGTLVNGVGYVGTNGGAFSFDGVNDNVSTSLDGPTTFLPSSNFTISCWVRATSFPSVSLATGTICGSFNFDGYGLFWEGSTTQLWLGCQMRARLSSTIVDRRSEINVNTWYFHSMTYSSSENFIGLYLNNSLVQSGSAISGSYELLSGRNISLGINWNPRGGGTASWFAGNIASTLIYNRALTLSEIQQNYNALKSRFINT